MKTLVVDDEAGTRTLIGSILKNMGHEVDFAENGHEALQLFVKAVERGLPYQFVSMDNSMPLMDGSDAYDLIRLFEGWQCDTPRAIICFVSSDESCLNKHKASAEPGIRTCFLHKPLNLLSFVDIVQRSENAGNSVILDMAA